MFSWEKVLSFHQKKLHKEEWQSTQNATCDLFAFADSTWREDPSGKKSVYAVVPAHLFLTQTQCIELAAAESFYLKQLAIQDDETELGTKGASGVSLEKSAKLVLAEDNANSDEERIPLISKVRAEVEGQSSKSLHFVCVDKQESKYSVNLGHPLLLGYRHWYYPVGQFDCPQLKCAQPTLNQCPHTFFNDIALVPIHHSQAYHLQSVLDSRNNKFIEDNIKKENSNQATGFQISNNLMQISTEKELRQLAGQEVLIQGMHGRIVYCILRNRSVQRFGFCINFVLTSQDSSGDMQ
ncbi:hypothetical protein EB796_005620 [Bugula neritina]|uniref:Uncharacterized protein n=1 Tax=Bugula neritina TaxID=10212 RepID=A0A7J7KDY6_BUGNE|nr:hypothetical protein EB796_005620 [Bugula neritina]